MTITSVRERSRNIRHVITEAAQMLIDSEVEKAKQIQAALRGELDGIRQVQGLTNRERSRLMARAVLAARGQLRDLRTASAEREAGEQRKAYLAAFGIDPTRASEERTLRAEIAAANPGALDTERMMDSALRIGDLLQAKAIASYAFDHRNDEMGGQTYRGVLDQYAGHSDGLTRIITNLAVFDGDVGNSGPAKLQRMADKLLTEVPQPHDLPGDLGSLAADDEPATGMMGMPFGQAG
jgi:hypothetical protein